MIKKIAIGLLGLFLLFVFSQMILAAVSIPSGGTALPTTIETYDDIKNIISGIANWMLGILIALSALFVIYAGYLYLFGAGDEEKIKTAKNYIIYAAVAIAVGLAAKGIVTIAGSFLGQTI